MASRQSHCAPHAAHHQLHRLLLLLLTRSSVTHQMKSSIGKSSKCGHTYDMVREPASVSGTLHYSSKKTQCFSTDRQNVPIHHLKFVASFDIVRRTHLFFKATSEVSIFLRGDRSSLCFAFFYLVLDVVDANVQNGFTLLQQFQFLLHSYITCEPRSSSYELRLLSSPATSSFSPFFEGPDHFRGDTVHAWPLFSLPTLFGSSDSSSSHSTGIFDCGCAAKRASRRRPLCRVLYLRTSQSTVAWCLSVALLRRNLRLRSLCALCPCNGKRADVRSFTVTNVGMDPSN